MVETLLPVSNAKSTNNNGNTALMFSVIRGNNKIVELLLPFSDIKAKNKLGMTALDLAKYYRHDQIVKLFQWAGQKLVKIIKQLFFGVLLSRFITFFFLRFLPLLKFLVQNQDYSRLLNCWGRTTKFVWFFSSSQTDVDHSKQDTTCKLNRLIQQ